MEMVDEGGETVIGMAPTVTTTTVKKLEEMKKEFEGSAMETPFDDGERVFRVIVQQEMKTDMTTTVEQLKEMVKGVAGKNKIDILFNGKPLACGKTLRECGVKQDSVQKITKPRNEELQIRLIYKEKIADIIIKLYEKVGRLGYVMKRSGWNLPPNFAFIRNNVKLNCWRSFNSYGIKEGDIIEAIED